MKQFHLSLKSIIISFVLIAQLFHPDIMAQNSRSHETALTTFTVKAYPNPHQDEFYVSVDPAFGGAKIEIYNTLGQLVQSETVNGVNTVINTKLLAKGLYELVVISYKKTARRLKLIKN